VTGRQSGGKPINVETRVGGGSGIDVSERESAATAMRSGVSVHASAHAPPPNRAKTPKARAEQPQEKRREANGRDNGGVVNHDGRQRNRVDMPQRRVHEAPSHAAQSPQRQRDSAQPREAPTSPKHQPQHQHKNAQQKQQQERREKQHAQKETHKEHDNRRHDEVEKGRRRDQEVAHQNRKSPQQQQTHINPKIFAARKGSAIALDDHHDHHARDDRDVVTGRSEESEGAGYDDDGDYSVEELEHAVVLAQNRLQELGIPY